MNEMFQLEGTTLRIILPQELDHPMADLIRKGTEMIAGRTYIRTIVFDFSETEFMDSSGIGLLMGRYRALGMRKDCIQAVGVNGHIGHLLRLSGLHRYIVIQKAGGGSVMREDTNEVSANEMLLIFESNPVNEGLARVTAASFCTQLNPTLEEIADLKTAVSEAVTNCIIHGYEGRRGRIEMHLSYRERELYVDITDYGVGISDVEKAMEPMYTSKPDKDRSGMGFTFMEAFMDELSVESEPDKGTVVHMKKIIGR